jgi:hypothetical protein
MKMTKQEKINFINDLLEMAKNDIVKEVEKMPDNWEGVELRQYILDYTNNHIAWTKMNENRYKKYLNDTIVYNLK